jgi:hypothetical protein
MLLPSPVLPSHFLTISALYPSYSPTTPAHEEFFGTQIKKARQEMWHGSRVVVLKATGP